MSPIVGILLGISVILLGVSCVATAMAIRSLNYRVSAIERQVFH